MLAIHAPVCGALLHKTNAASKCNRSRRWVAGYPYAVTLTSLLLLKALAPSICARLFVDIYVHTSMPGVRSVDLAHPQRGRVEVGRLKPTRRGNNNNKCLRLINKIKIDSEIRVSKADLSLSLLGWR